MNKKYQVAKLTFKSPLHLSKGKSGLDTSFEVLHSDTLKSALFSCALELYGNEQILRGGEGRDFFESFRISSAFPFVGDLLFFPRPWQITAKAEEDLDRKKLKKVHFIERNYFQQLLNGTLSELYNSHIQNRRFYTSTALLENQPFKSETVQRVIVSRTYEEDAKPFYTERLFFAENCGLFFLIEFENDHFKQHITAALRLLGDNGVGSDKSVGNGQFEFGGFEPFDFQFDENANKQVSLSLFSPNANEVQDKAFLEGSAYSLVKRGGYLANPENFDKTTLRKRSVVMFTEGSVFPNDKKLKGDVKDLKPTAAQEHAIWRDGRALFFPYNLKEA